MMASMRRSEPKSTAGMAVYEELRRKIVNNQLPGGSQLLEEQVSADLKVSRTPVREALSRLELEGLVQPVRRHGYLVAPITIADIDQIYQVLSPLETVAAELLASKKPNDEEVFLLQACVDKMDAALKKDDLDAWAAADELFHIRLAELCGNERLARAAKLLWAQSQRVRLFTLRLREKPLNSVKSHGALVDAIRKHKPAEARKVHGNHREKWTTDMSRLLRSLNIHQL